ncbi:MAG: hypothetical protein J7L04_01640 [Bacteroidales bacterium]|nr:hypothetical protein [Bacteroidales bacterium]
MKKIINQLSKASLILIGLIIVQTSFSQRYKDNPYLQDHAQKYEIENQLSESTLFQARADRNGIVKVLSSNGLLQPWEKSLVKDQLYPFMTDLTVKTIEVFQNQFFYMTEKAVFSNSWAGKIYVEHNMPNSSKFCVGDEFSILIAEKGGIAFFKNQKKTWGKNLKDFNPIDLIFDKKNAQFLILSNNAIYIFDLNKHKLTKKHDGNDLTAMALLTDKNQIAVGTKNGIYYLNGNTFEISSPLSNKLPDSQITCIREINGKLWFGSARGAFSLRDDGKYDYYASKRWLVDDEVTDISAGPGNSVLVLSKTGLSKIIFTEMTLAEKAEYFQKVQRLRHIRFGFSSETMLTTPGDLSTAILHDTDNDGLWTSMYLAGELFRYGATKSEDALQNAYEAFEAMERLTEISGIKGFPARTYEIDAYQSSDTDPNMPEDQKIWRLTEDKRWRWKSTTSSDETCGHFFAYALFAEIIPDKEWKDRAIHQIKIEMDHIIENDWYLVTWNGEITEWGKWNPDYVNSFPINVGDRRLNSTLILAFLQTAYHFTGEEIYKEKAFELMKDYGYDENASRPATVIGKVDGQSLSNTWNHSDDEMYFLTIPAFVNYAFNDELKKDFFEAAKSHWEVERSEKNPLWNFIYALAGGEDYDLDESVWWLKEFPLDLVSWTVNNSHRQDLTRVEQNFRRQEYTEVLPRDERPMHLHNNAYRNNGRSDGKREYPPYLYLLPYWAGRYVNAIGPGNK